MSLIGGEEDPAKRGMQAVPEGQLFSGTPGGSMVEKKKVSFSRGISLDRAMLGKVVTVLCKRSKEPPQREWYGSESPIFSWASQLDPKRLQSTAKMHLPAHPLNIDTRAQEEPDVRHRGRTEEGQAEKESTFFRSLQLEEVESREAGREISRWKFSNGHSHGGAL